MKMKSEKGFTPVDIAISVVILFIFISLISILSYNFNSSAKEIELKTQATNIAITEIEKIKNKTIEELESQKDIYSKSEQIQEGYTREVEIKDYHDIDSTKESGIVKKVTVKIKYKFKKQIETIELSTIVSKEN